MSRLAKVFAGLMVLGFTAHAQATSLHPETFAIRPVVNDVQIVVKGLCDPQADTCLAVEPWTEVSFTHTSCATMPFSVSQTQLANGTTRISLIIPAGTHDCMGPRSPKSYSLQLNANFNLQTYVLENPIGFVPSI